MNNFSMPTKVCRFFHQIWARWFTWLEKPFSLTFFTILVSSFVFMLSINGSMSLALASARLLQAQMCESVVADECIGASVVFPVRKGQVFCYTVFDGLPLGAVVYHRWYHRGELSTQISLKLSEPGKPVYSFIQLREADKGPWQVEIVDGTTGRVLGVLMFSITD
ncbi:MAG: DUF2914 domain-containing protein [Deltaproteobacteria bacterium]|nr:DUF2914 domain-containing protein [Deltaproteobacteria bacterium]MBW2067787.1 DUF2914 domain-containing protein [Deltaproteobacteria bacterium]